ncbi:MAG: organic hydroperoxide resistance protein, partial [Proteobacteria bacterium]
MAKLAKVIYTASAKTTGGREGKSETNDGRLKVTLSTPKGLGGNDGPGTNPEQLFAAGYAACFIGALKFAAGQSKVKLPDDLSVDSKVHIGPEGKGFGLQVEMHVTLPGFAKADAEAIVKAAHDICP